LVEHKEALQRQFEFIIIFKQNLVTIIKLNNLKTPSLI
jgi:hypothetical protein